MMALILLEHYFQLLLTAYFSTDYCRLGRVFEIRNFLTTDFC